jgi:heptosyltransferase-2
MDKVSVVILTANRLSLLKECIASVRTGGLQPHEIVVVENGSSDGTADWLASAGVTVVPRDGSGSFAAARNAGVAAASGDWVAFLDDDCLADEHWLERLLAAARANGWVACGGAVLPADEVTADPVMPPEVLWAVGLLPEEFFGPLGGRRVLPTTTNLLASRQLLIEEPFQELGGSFEEGAEVYIQGREDAEWWRRLRQSGRPVGLARRAIVWHRVAAERFDWETILERGRNDGRAAWSRKPEEETARSAARDVLHFPLALATELAAGRIGAMDSWRTHRLWLARQWALLVESTEGASALHPERRFRIMAGELPRALLNAARAGLRPLAVAAGNLWDRERDRDLYEEPPGHLLIVLHDFLGDAVLALPMIRQAVAGLKSSRITVLCGPVARPILEGNVPDSVRLVSVPNDARGRLPRAQWRLGKLIRRLEPDAILVAYAHGLAPAPILMAGVPVISWREDNGFGQRMWGELVTHPVGKSFRKSEVAALLDLLGPFGIGTRLERPALSISEKAGARAMGILKEAGLNRGEAVVIHLERGGRWKIWPPEEFRELARRLVEAGKHVFLVGSRADRALARGICREVGVGCESLHGVIDTAELAALLDLSKLFIGCDSGPAHVAQAVGCRCVLLFGATERHRWGPLPPLPGESAHSMVEIVAAAPGDWLGEEAHGMAPDAAMRLLPADKVWQAVKRMMEGEENFPNGVESH